MIFDDRTAADKKYVAYCDPPQAENLESQILFRLGVYFPIFL